MISERVLNELTRNVSCCCMFVIDNGKGMTPRQLNNWAIYRLSKFIRKDKRDKVYGFLLLFFNKHYTLWNKITFLTSNTQQVVFAGVKFKHTKAKYFALNV